MGEVKSWVRWSVEDASATGCSPPRCPAGPAWQGVRSEEEGEDHFWRKNFGDLQRKFFGIVLWEDGPLDPWSVGSRLFGGRTRCAPGPPKNFQLESIFLGSRENDKPTCTSPWYMKLRRSLRSSSLTSLKMMIGCEHGLLWEKGNCFNSSALSR